MSKPTIAAGFPKAFLDFACSKGIDRRKLMEQARIRPEDIKEQDNRIPLENYVTLLKGGIEMCNEPALALLFGEAVSLPDISIVGLIGAGVENVEKGHQQMNRYIRLMLDDDEEKTSDRIAFVREKGDVWLKFTSSVYVENSILTESAFARAVCGTRAMLAANGISINRPFPKAIHFTHQEPSYRAEFDRIFGVPLVFGSDTNGFLLDEQSLSFIPPQTNPYLSRILSAHAETLLKNLENSKSVRGRIESLLIPMLDTGEASRDSVARKLGISRQTLFRKLKAEGTTFEKVLNELRRKLAIHYLNEKKISVCETAYLLGFSEPSAFSRAFKRWTGYSPKTAQVSNVIDSRER